MVRNLEEIINSHCVVHLFSILPVFQRSSLCICLYICHYSFLLLVFVSA